jgi:hypothetical protein
LRVVSCRWSWLSVALVAGACGRVPLDQGPGSGEMAGGAGGNAGGAGVAAAGGGGSDVGGAGVAGSGAPGAAGTSGKVPAQHRPAGASCPPRDVPDNLCAFSQPGPGGRVPGACYSDADCTAEGPGGHCISLTGMTSCQCAYDQCFRDGDCRDGSACFCQSVLFGNVCLSGGCRVDGDCGVGGFCSLSAATCGGIGNLQCHTRNDTCVDDADCVAPQFCGYDSSLRAWRCQYHALCL